MRILIVDTCYPSFLRSLYQRQPGLSAEPYAAQWWALMDAFFGTADSYSHYLGELGHTAHEFIVNCPQLQARWSAEHGFRPPSARFRGDRLTRESTILAQASDFEPDVCFVQNLEVLQERTLRELKQTGALLAGQLSTEPPSRRRLRLFDLLVSPLPSFVEQLRHDGIAAEYLPLAFDSRALDRAGPRSGPARWDTVFVGSLKRYRRWNSNRVIERASHRVPIDFWGYGAKQWPRSSPIRRRYHGEAWGLEMLRLLRDSRIAVNRHGDLTGPYAANMRLYEATGMGTLLVTDAKQNLSELFRPGVEVVEYHDVDELVEVIRHYSSADDERATIAAAGQARTTSEHGYDRRMVELVAILTRHATMSPER